MMALPLYIKRHHSSLHLPDRGAIFLVLELDAHGRELVADAVGVLEVSGLAGGVAGIDQRDDLVLVDVALAFGSALESECPQSRAERGEIARAVQGMEPGDRLR